MNRREFVKTTSLLTLPVILKSCNWLATDINFDVKVSSDIGTGHLLLKSKDFPLQRISPVETLIVGGGISGMSAACKLKNNDFLLCELSDNLGGSSSADSFNGNFFSQGAHYDYAYPKNYGPEVLSLLEELNIIEFLPWTETWSFKDHQHLIKHRRKNQCYSDGNFRHDVIPNEEQKKQLINIMEPYIDEMVLPTRLIDPAYQHFNDISLLDFVTGKMPVDEGFIRGLDYYMKDDYGAGCKQVSALAGIHYFACRPYYSESVELFSPPEGNHYFIKKMKRFVGEEQLLTSHMISAINKSKNGFEVQIIDVKQQLIKVVQVKNIIYAGQKHALKYIYPEAAPLFRENTYAPWMVVNMVVSDSPLPAVGYWQNEMLTEDESFMGFVDSRSQQPTSNGQRILSAYYCLTPSLRTDLVNVENNKMKIAEVTIRRISEYFGVSVAEHVHKVFIKAMGHAMPIPSPGYLFKDKNNIRTEKNLVFAGVDNSRLPLLFEAIDSGITAVNLLKG
ncbi:NAD(P)-binding protein [Fulvivirga ulvae]|uniref:NAD(P)/FAD-dependent oxidoreductase n=1 Tax=Fulvivirga ulvae TaxID=2904245 RepID=UPI001F478746|nr:NAD(P)/FAD-dependent oxidoreductase [Fulvivirga ulvae]UII33098.1 NAD(P)-binding protein [Fulvivirga ulvae]